MIGCKQCGRCCKKTKFWEVCSSEDWKLVYDLFMKRYEGLVNIWVPYYGAVTLDIIGFDTKYGLEKGNANLYWLLDRLDCPFIQHVRDNRGRFTGKYYCEFHGTEAKPIGCREFPIKKGRNHANKFCGCRYFED